MSTCGCHGCGEAGCVDCANGNIIEHMEICPECNGEGTYLGDEQSGLSCPFCNGKGLLNEEEWSQYEKWQNDLNEKSGVPKCY